MKRVVAIVNMKRITNYKWYNNLGIEIKYDDLIINNSDIISPDLLNKDFIHSFIWNKQENKRNTICVKWQLGEKIIQLNNVGIYGTMPNVSMDKVVCSKGYELSAVIYNADGSIHLSIEHAPNRISDFSSRYKTSNALSPTFFRRIAHFAG